jgi:hypothetical protein
MSNPIGQKIIKNILLLYLQSDLEEILSYMFQVLCKKIGDKKHSFNCMDII